MRLHLNLTSRLRLGAAALALSPMVAPAIGGAATLSTLASFDWFTTGGVPQAGLLADSAGNFFGTTREGGAGGYGTVFELAKGIGGYTLSTLATFDGTNGANPYASLIADSAGNLFGTTYYGGAGYVGGGGGTLNTALGTVFELAKGSAGYTLSTLYPFNLMNFGDGVNPSAGLLADSAGNLFGTTYQGGVSVGTVFQMTDSGFVPYATDVPAPAGLGLFGMGLAALGLVRRRRAAR